MYIASYSHNGLHWIDWCRNNIIIYSTTYIAVTLNKVKSFEFMLPCYTDYEKIMDGLTETEVLHYSSTYIYSTTTYSYMHGI